MAAGDSPPPPFTVVVDGPRILRPLPASADRPRPRKSCLRVRSTVGFSLNFASSVHCTQTPVSPHLPRRRQANGRAVLARAKPMRFAAAALPAPSGGSVGVEGPDPSPLSIEDLMSIYRIVYATQPGADPFENGEIKHLKKSLEGYLSRQPERHKALHKLPRIVSEPEDASVDFDVLIVPADADRNVDEVKFRWKTQMLLHEVPHYKVLAARFKNLPRASEFIGTAKPALLALLAYEIRYLRGSDIVWVGESIPMPSQGLAAVSGPCYYCLVLSTGDSLIWIFFAAGASSEGSDVECTGTSKVGGGEPAAGLNVPSAGKGSGGTRVKMTPRFRLASMAARRRETRPSGHPSGRSSGLPDRDSHGSLSPVPRKKGGGRAGKKGPG